MKLGTMLILLAFCRVDEVFWLVEVLSGLSVLVNALSDLSYRSCEQVFSWSLNSIYPNKPCPLQ
jgi:hypothetical protein